MAKSVTNSITNRQMVFIIFLTLTTYTSIDLPKVVAETAGRSSWIPILAISVLFGAVAIIITKLNNMHPNKVLFDYNQELVGKFLAYLIAIYYLLYFLFIGVFLKSKFVGLLQSNFLPKTPTYVTLFFGIALFGYVAYKGITNIARGFEIVGVLFLIITVGMSIMMITEGMYSNILPFYNPADIKNFAETMKDSVLPFGGLEVLLVIPFTANNKKAPKIAFFTLLLIGVFYVLIVESTFMILGLNNTIALNYSLIEAIRVVEVPVVERTDVLYLTIGLTSLFSGMIIVYLAVTELACRLFARIKRNIVVIIIGIVFYIISIFGQSLNKFSEIYESYAVYPVLFSAVLIPSILFIVAKLKNMRKAKRREHQNEQKYYKKIY